MSADDTPRDAGLDAAVDADKAVRLRVRHELRQPFAVEAGAGTGKTTLLIERICNLVAAGVALRTVAAITFTEKAAGDLKIRLRRALLEAYADANTAGDDAAGRCRTAANALADLESAAITTIHSFCVGILREHPFAAGVDPRFTVATGPMSALLWEGTFDAWLTAQLHAPTSGLAAAIGAGLTPQHLRDLARGLRDQPDCPNLPAQVGADPTAFASDARATIATLHALAAPVSDAEHGVGQIRALHAHAAALAGAPPAQQALAWADAIAALSYMNRYGTKKHWGRSREAERAKFKEEVLALRDRATTFTNQWFGDLLTGALSALRGALDAYTVAKQRRGWLDFDDLLLQTRDLLVSRPDVAAAVSARWPIILVDEVQDTDPLQAQVLQALLAVPRPPGGPAALTLVGDPKQSLYRFRRADLTLYNALADALVDAGGERVTITRTRRNTPRLAAWVNRVCQRVMTHAECASTQAAWVPLHSTEHEPAGAGPPVVLVTLPDDAAPLDAQARRRLESWRIANLLKQAVESKAWIVRDRDTGPRPAEYRDIALLFRNFSYVELWEEALRAAEVPFRVSGGKLFFRRLEVQALAALAAAIDDPADALAVAAALKGPLIGCSDDDLLQHRAAHHRLDPLQPASGACAEPLATLGALHRARNAQPVADTLALALDAFRAWPLLRSLSSGDHRVANVHKLLDLARAQEATGLATFRAFTRFLQRFGDERGAAEPDSQIGEADAAAVRLCTVHGAKGLEWPVVVLSDVAAGRVHEVLKVTPVRVDQRCEVSISIEGVHWHTAGAEAAEAEEALHRQAEERRTFYVACTRACDRLVVPALWGKRNEGYAAYLQEAGEHLGEDAEVVVIQPLQPGEVPPSGSPVRPDFAAGPAHPIVAQRRAWRTALGALLEPTVKPAMATEPTPQQPPPPPPQSESQLAAAEHGRAVGLAVHEVLEHCDLAEPGDLHAACLAAARAHGVAASSDAPALAAAVAEVRELVDRGLALDVTRRAAAAPRIWRELPLFVEIEIDTEDLPAGSARIASRRLDMLFEEDGRLILADWKTDQALTPHSQAQYQEQLGSYAQALAAAGRPVSEAWLLLVRTGEQIAVSV